MGHKLAIDVGGTFTDVVFVNEETGSIHFTKTPTSPGNPSKGVLNGIDKIVSEVKIKPQNIDYFIHGTTYATNAFLEGNGSDVALLTTEGFIDVIEIGRQKRNSLYDLFQEKPSFIVERQFRYGIKERMNSKGEIITPLNESQLKKVVEEIKRENITSIAISYLHSYANPEHELKTAELIKRWYPECDVSMSHEISPEFREYERTITTVVNAYLKPKTRNYFLDLSDKLTEGNLKSPYIMKSSGGAMTLDVASERPVETLLSGPTGGVIGSTYLAKKLGIQNIITLDMGGTSTDVSMILNQKPKITMESQFKGYTLKVPMIDMETVGAGGGSIGWIDEGNLLKVGPKSAGATPGPACYGRGGAEPTITDANLILGRLDPTTFHNGEMDLDTEASRKSFTNIMDKTGMSIEEAALGIVEIANHHMAEAVRLVTIRKGFDPKDFALFSFGGASPLHASEIAKALNIPKVVIPKISSEMSAFGFLAADIRHDFALTKLTPLNSSASEVINESFRELEENGESLLEKENVPLEKRLYLYRADLRYRGQAFEITIETGTPDGKNDINLIKKRFHQQYERQYGHYDEKEPIEIVNFRLSAIGLSPKLEIERLPENGDSVMTNKGFREVYLKSSKKFEKVPVYDMKALLVNEAISGPAIVDGVNTTIMLEARDDATLDHYGNLVISIGGQNK